MSIQSIEDQLGQLAVQKQSYFRETIQNQQKVITELENQSNSLKRELAAKFALVEEKSELVLEYETKFGQLKTAICDRDA
jgi:hypothetical protein